jgi:hypothetical protein
MNRDNNVQSVQDIDFPHQIRHSIPASGYKDLAMKKNRKNISPHKKKHQTAGNHQNHLKQSFEAYPTFLYIT